jgi:hypothetical protein
MVEVVVRERECAEKQDFAKVENINNTAAKL